MEDYNRLFELYLKLCTRNYDPKQPYDNLDVCCRRCNEYGNMLSGMIALLEQMNVITDEQAEKENEKINKTFSTRALFNATVEKGEIYVFVELEKPEKQHKNKRKKCL